MAKIAHHALDRGWQNCGAYSGSGLIWLWPLDDLFCRDRYNGGTHRAQILFPHELIAELARCRDAGLITGDLDNLEKLMTKSQHLRDANDAAEPAKVHSAHTPDAEQFQGTPSSAYSDLLSMSRPSSPVLQYFPQMEQHVATVASVSAELTPDELLSPSQELDGHDSTSDADRIYAPGVSLILASSSSLDTPDIFVPVFDTPANARDGPTSIAPNLPLDHSEASTSAATVITQISDIGTPASRDPRTRRTRGDAIAGTARDSIELHDLGAAQTKSQVLLMEKHEHVEETSTFSIDDCDTPVSLEGSADLVCYILLELAKFYVVMLWSNS